MPRKLRRVSAKKRVRKFVKQISPPSMIDYAEIEHPNELSNRLLQNCFDAVQKGGASRERDYLLTRYYNEFGEQAPSGMMNPLIKARLVYHLQYLGHKLLGMVDSLSERVMKNYRAAWSDNTVNGNFKDFDEDSRIIFGIIKHYEEQQKIKSKEKAMRAKAEKAGKVEKVVKITMTSSKVDPKSGLYPETGTRFKKGHHRQIAFILILALAKKGKSTKEIRTALREHKGDVKLYTGHLATVCAAHPEVFQVFSDDSIKVLNDGKPKGKTIKAGVPAKKKAPVKKNKKAPVKKKKKTQSGASKLAKEATKKKASAKKVAKKTPPKRKLKK